MADIIKVGRCNYLHYEKARRELIEYYNTCPLCKGPTTDCRMIRGNRECIACTNNETLFGYSYRPKIITREMILSRAKYYFKT